MIVLVTGGRDFSDRDMVDKVLDSIHAETPINLLVHGAARGADTLANLWAFSRGVQPAACPALWDYYGKPAGHKRNCAMLLIKPDLVVAFPGGSGTSDMYSLASEAGIRAFRYEFVNQDLIS
jgi:hypothetical protein